MIGRRTVVVNLVAALAAPFAANAQPDRKRQLGILSINQPASPEEIARSSFRRALRELGWIEGQNLLVTTRYGAGSVDKLTAMAAELVRLKVDVIFAGSAVAAAAAKRTTSTVPIVFVTLSDPVAQGLVTSLAQPSGNATGVAAEPTAGKRLELLHALVPNIKRVAVLVNRANPATSIGVRELEHSAGVLRLELKIFAIGTPGDLDQVWPAIAASRPDGLVVADDPVLLGLGARIRERAGRSKLPVVYGHREDALQGGLAAFSAILDELVARAAGYVDRILRGADPRQLPVQRAERFETVINLKTAKALGLAIPASVLVRADQVVE